MYFFLVGFGVLLHVLAWGAGGALLAMPRRWARFWPVVVAPVGLGLQALVVWLGAYLDFAGTDQYAWFAEAVPLLLLFAGGYRRGWRQVAQEMVSFRAVWLVVAVCLCGLLVPLAIAAKGVGLTSVSLGSCDAADYAAGARVLKEFARSDRSGFLGLTEVVSVLSTDNFFDYWLRLNHFAPAALIALNGTVFDCAPHELTSIMSAVLLATTLPLVFWLARSTLHYGPRVSAWIALLYSFSPVTWYGVFQAAMGQLMATQAIALLTWAGIALWRGRLTGRRGWEMSAVLFAGYVIVLASYNFILLVVWVPAVAGVGGLALWKGQWRRLARWGWLIVAPLAACGVVMAGRFAGLAERFQLLQSYDFGWRIPGLSPEGWLGMLPAGYNLVAFPLPWRVLLATLVTALVASALIIGAKRRRTEVYIALALAVPVLAGYGYLNLRGVTLGTNASYDAYKLLAVFYPGVLAALCFWATLLRHPAAGWRGLAATFAVMVTGLSAHAAYRFGARMENPPLIVGRELLGMRKVESMSDVKSVNLRLPDMWSRLWANTLLLRKPQYFPTHTYEARLNTPLRGDWDLNGGLIEVQLPKAGSRVINSQISLAEVHSRYFVRANVGEGWYDIERQPRAIQRWRWTRGNATVVIENPQSRPLRVQVRFLDIRSLVDRDFQVWIGGKQVRTVHTGKGATSLRLPEMVIVPGETQVAIQTTNPGNDQPGADSRPLGFRIFGIEIEVLTDTG